MRLLVAFGPATLPRLDEVRLDGVALAFTFALSLLAALAFGAIPLLRGAPLAALAARERTRQHGQPRPPPRASPADGRPGRAGAGAARVVRPDGPQLPEAARDRSRLRRLVGAHVPHRACRIATIRIGARPSRRITRSSIGCRRFRASPPSPPRRACRWRSGVFRQHDAWSRAATSPTRHVPPIALFRAVAGGYFEAMGMRLLRGRGIDRGDVERSEPDRRRQPGARGRVFPEPGSDRPARRLEPGRRRAGTARTWLTIVGVVSNTPIDGARRGAIPCPSCSCRCPSPAGRASRDRAGRPRRRRDELCRAIRDAAARTAAVGAPRHRRRRREPGARAGAHAAGHARPRLGADGVHDGAARDRRRRRADARRDRHLRRHVLHREPAHGRDRRAPRARRGAGERRAA